VDDPARFALTSIRFQFVYSSEDSLDSYVIKVRRISDPALDT